MSCGPGIELKLQLSTPGRCKMLEASGIIPYSVEIKPQKELVVSCKQCKQPLFLQKPSKPSGSRIRSLTNHASTPWPLEVSQQLPLSTRQLSPEAYHAQWAA